METTALVVDDCAINRTVLKKKLERENVAADVAEDGFESLKLLEESSYSIVFLDIQMPGMSGYEVLERMRATHPAIPYIAWACSIAEEPTDLISRGFTDALDKPITEDSLHRILRDYLGTPDQEEELKVIPLDLQAELSLLQHDSVLTNLHVQEHLTSYLTKALKQSRKRKLEDVRFLLRKARGSSKTAGLPIIASELKKIEMMCDQLNFRHLIDELELFLSKLSTQESPYPQL